MPTNKTIRERINKLKKLYEESRRGKESLLKIIDEAELADNVYNSNAIENSTLSLKETEKILMEIELSRKVSLREVFEAKNLAKVVDFIRKKSQKSSLDKDLILLLHKVLLNNINDQIAGRFRAPGEYVRVGYHIAPPPEHIDKLLDEAFIEYDSDQTSYFLDKIAKFHLRFENIHPFNDGNGRIGRVIINYQLQSISFPPVILRNKDKQKYYEAFQQYDNDKNTKIMEVMLSLALMESLHKRLAYLQGKEIISLSQYSKQSKKSFNTLLNAAKRQTIAAFREKEVWKIAID